MRLSLQVIYVIRANQCCPLQLSSRGTTSSGEKRQTGRRLHFLQCRPQYRCTVYSVQCSAVHCLVAAPPAHYCAATLSRAAGRELGTFHLNYTRLAERARQ